MMRWFDMENPEADAGHPLAALIVKGARACVGARFRPQGRGPEAYDCLGVVLASARAAGVGLLARADYALGSCDVHEVLHSLRSQCCDLLDEVEGVAGDFLVMERAPGLVHFAVLTDLGLVEAHMGLRRVIERPMRQEEQWHSSWRMPVGDLS